MESTTAASPNIVPSKKQSKQPNLIEALRAELISARYTGPLDDQTLLDALASESYDVKRALEKLCPNLNRAASFHVTGKWLW